MTGQTKLQSTLVEVYGNAQMDAAAARQKTRPRAGDRLAMALVNGSWTEAAEIIRRSPSIVVTDQGQVSAENGMRLLCRVKGSTNREEAVALLSGSATPLESRLRLMQFGGKRSDHCVAMTITTEAQEDVVPGKLAYWFGVRHRSTSDIRWLLSTSAQSLRQVYSEADWEIAEVSIAVPREQGEPWRPTRVTLEG